MTELARRTTGEVDPAEAARLSKSKLVPEHIANDGASAEYMMRFGAALGIDPMSSFQHIFVFPDGKGRLRAGMSAHLMQALAIGAGHTVAFTEANAIKATAVLVRKTSSEQLQRFQMMREEERRQKFGQLEDLDRLYKMQRGQLKERIEDLQSIAALEQDSSVDKIRALLTGDDEPSIDDIKGILAMEGNTSTGEELLALRKQLADLHGQYDFQTLRESVSTTNFDLSKLVRFESTWTMARATQIGLTTKDVWKKYGPEMLKNRGKSTVVRDGAIDVILGVRNILSEMGLLLSEDDHDNLAVANSAYTPEEAGADVDEHQRPIMGEVINVTEAKASKVQARLAEWAEGVTEKAEADQIAAWATNLLTDEKIGTDNKISRIYAIQRAAEKAGKGDEVVTSGEHSIPLTIHLDSTISSLR